MQGRMDRTLPASTWRLGYRPALDGLRAIAVAMVVIYHSGLVKGSLGAAGVTVFFTLSGYLITQLLLEERAASGAISLRSFYLRRVRRLLPALWVMVACATVLGLLTGHPHTLVEALLALTYLGNLPSVAGNAGQPLSHTWSLAIEEQFYLLWPLVIIVTRRRGVALILAVAGSIVLASHRLIAPADPDELAFATVMQADALLIGATVALIRWRDERGWAGWCALVALLTLGATGLSQRTIPIVIGTLTAATLTAAVGHSFFARLLSWRPLVIVGKRSYGLYLWHLPILFYVGVLGHLQPLVTPFALLLALAVTEASYRWIERPLRQLGRQAVADPAPSASSPLQHPKDCYCLRGSVSTRRRRPLPCPSSSHP